MAGQFENIERKLENWGDWARSGHDNVGWPSITALGRFAKEGAVIQGNNGAEKTDNPDAEKMDFVVGMLAKPLKDVVFARYIYHKNNREGAAMCKMSESSYKNMMNVALSWIDGYLYKG